MPSVIHPDTAEKNHSHAYSHDPVHKQHSHLRSCTDGWWYCCCCMAALRSASFMMLWSDNLFGWRLEPVWCHIHTGNDKSFKFICFALRQCATLPCDTTRWLLTSEDSVRAYGSLWTLRRTRSAIICDWNPAPVCRISQQDFSALWSGLCQYPVISSEEELITGRAAVMHNDSQGTDKGEDPLSVQPGCSHCASLPDDLSGLTSCLNSTCSLRYPEACLHAATTEQLG